MKPYYECNITFIMMGRQAEYIEAQTGWKFTRMHLGDNFRCVLTKSFPASENTSHTSAEAGLVVRKMADVAIKLRGMNLEVLRERVDLVVFDTRPERP